MPAEDIEAELTLAPRRPRSEAVVRWGLAVLVLGFLVLAVGDRWSDVRSSLSTVSVWAVLGAWVLVTVALLGPWRAWHAILADLGNQLPWRTSAKIFFIGQLGKYVPGAVWPLVLQMQLARPAGVTRTRIAVCFMVTLVQGVATGFLVGLLALPTLIEDSVAWAWALLLIPVAVVALIPRVASAAVRMALRATKRPSEDFHLSAVATRRALTAYGFFWALAGLHVWLLVVDLGADPLSALPVSIGAWGLAMGLGPVIVFLPAGAGVREAVLVAALTTMLPLPDAVAVALVSRAVVVLGDCALGLIAFLAARGGRG